MNDADALRLLRLEANRERKVGPAIPSPGLLPYLEGMFDRLWVRAQVAEILLESEPEKPKRRKRR